MKKIYGWTGNGLDDYLWDVRMAVARKKGMDAASVICDPLTWFVRTGRITTSELKTLVTIKPYVMARLLMTEREKNSVQCVVDAIKEKIAKA